MSFADVRSVTRALIVTALAIVLAVLCWMSAIDRMGLIASQPGKIYFGGSAATQASFDDLAANDPRAALRQARWAIRTAPIEPSAPSAFGSASLALGKSSRAYAAFAVAGSMGWRDIPTQLYWLSQAAAAGDIDVVKERLDALLRLNIESDAVASSLDLLERTKTGRVALAMLLSENPPWERQFLIDTGKLDGDDFDGRMAAINLAAANRVVLDCDAVGTAANQLIVHGRIVDAKNLWRHACDRSGDIYLSDGSFETDPAKLLEGPFDWRLQARAGIDADIAPAPAPLKGHALRIASSMTVRALVARQLAALRPGRYHLTWQTALDDGKPDDSIAVLIDCNGSTSLETAGAVPMPGLENFVSKTFTVPSQGCPIQAIDIQKAASASGETQTGWIDNVEIAPA